MDDASASTLEGLRAGRDQSRRILGDLIHTSGSTSANGARTNISEPERPGVRRFVRKQTDRPDL